MNIKRIIALLLIVVLFVCIIPANAFAAQLRICDAEDYPETYTFNGNVPNLPAAFANHTSSNFNYTICGAVTIQPFTAYR